MPTRHNYDMAIRVGEIFTIDTLLAVLSDIAGQDIIHIWDRDGMIWPHGLSDMIVWDEGDPRRGSLYTGYSTLPDKDPALITGVHYATMMINPIRFYRRRIDADNLFGGYSNFIHMLDRHR